MTDFIEDDTHDLLEPPPPAYSNTTVRRAFVVWMYCGQKNKFKDVCNYYHRLEAMEDSLSIEARATSRHHEFKLFSNRPPCSVTQHETYPGLYCQSNFEHRYIKDVEAIKNDKNVFKLEGFYKYSKEGVSPKDITDTSQLVRRYCSDRHWTLRNFLMIFETYAEKCHLEKSVLNISFYIKRKSIKDELALGRNLKKVKPSPPPAPFQDPAIIQSTILKERNENQNAEPNINSSKDEDKEEKLLKKKKMDKTKKEIMAQRLFNELLKRANIIDTTMKVCDFLHCSHNRIMRNKKADLRNVKFCTKLNDVNKVQDDIIISEVF